MSESYLGEIDLFAFNFAPQNWALCNGQLMSIAQNQALFALLGTTFGGNGVSTFALPDLRGRVPIGAGSTASLTIVLGEPGGTETTTLSAAEMPAHTHGLSAATPAVANTTTGTPAQNVVLAQASGQDAHGEIVPYDIYVADAAPALALAPAALAGTGGNQPHPNLMPYLTLNYCIALAGVFPSRN